MNLFATPVPEAMSLAYTEPASIFMTEGRACAPSADGLLFLAERQLRLLANVVSELA